MVLGRLVPKVITMNISVFFRIRRDWWWGIEMSPSSISLKASELFYRFLWLCRHVHSGSPTEWFTSLICTCFVATLVINPQAPFPVLKPCCELSTAQRWFLAFSDCN